MIRFPRRRSSSRTRPTSPHAEASAGNRDSRRTTAFVLSGGGHLGAVQIGMLRALFEHGIEPDVYVACSVGALNAAVMSAVPGLAGVDHLEETWLGLGSGDLFPASSVSQAWAIARGQSHLHPNVGVLRLISSAVPATHFHHLAVPLRIVTTVLRTGEERVFASGQLMRPLLASTALPGLLPPVSIDGQLFVDGGVVNNVPISHAVEADRVFVLAVSDGAIESVPTSTWGMLMRGYAISRSVRFRIDVARYQEETELVVLPVPTNVDVRFPDLGKTVELAALGYEAASKFLSGDRKSASPDDLGPWIPSFQASRAAVASETDALGSDSAMPESLNRTRHL